MQVERRLTRAAFVAAGILLMGTPSPWIRTVRAQDTRPQPVRSGIDLITIDATVVSGDGTPVRGLGPTDFSVTVDGKPRRVVGWQYVEAAARDTAAAHVHVPPRFATFSSNERSSAQTPSGRITVLAIDRASFLPGRGRQTLEAAQQFLSRLDPGERVALALFPDPGSVLLPTTDRASVARALDQVTGSASPLTVPGINVPLSLGEAVEVAAGNQLAITQVYARECGGYRDATARDMCHQNVQGAAGSMVRTLQEQAVRSLAGLAGVLSALEGIDGRKHVVLVSAGLFQSDGRTDRAFFEGLRQATSRAAAAEATIRVLYVDGALADAMGSGRMSETMSQDATLMIQGLQTLASMNGGALFRITGSAQTTFARVALEMSAYHELAIETEAGDRDGKVHTISVKVPGRGITVRHRQQFSIDGAGAGTGTIEQQLVAAVRSGRVLRDLPVRVSTITFRDPAVGAMRVLVRAEAGTGARVPADMTVAMAVLDERGRLTGSTSGVKRLTPAPGTGEAWSFTDAVNLREGSYTLRLAIADADGRMGTVAHRFDAKLAVGTGARLSEILVVDSDLTAGHQPVPSLDGLVRGRTLSAVVEAYPDGDVTAVDFSFAIAADDHGPALLSSGGMATANVEERRVSATAEFDLIRLPPGDYVVTAAALVRGNVLGRVSRPFTLAAPAAADGGTPSGVAVPRLRFVPGEAGPLARPFARADVLQPGTLTYFLNRLRSFDTREVSPAVEAALHAASRGEFGTVLPALARADRSQLSVTFLTGLALFARGELEAAAAAFRASADVSSGFLPAAFYLGACYAAGGRDEQAVGAWQTALVSEAEARIIFDVLADALLRLGDGQESLAVITEARERWPDDDTLLPRLAAARSLTGETGSALDTIETYLGRHPEDLDTIVLGLRILYDTHAAGRVARGATADAALATTLARRYRAAGGPQADQLDRWAAFIQPPARRR